MPCWKLSESEYLLRNLFEPLQHFYCAATIKNGINAVVFCLYVRRERSPEGKYVIPFQNWLRVRVVCHQPVLEAFSGS